MGEEDRSPRESTFGSSNTQLSFAQVLKMLNEKSQEIRAAADDLKQLINKNENRILRTEDRLSTKVAELYREINKKEDAIEELRLAVAKMDAVQQEMKNRMSSLEDSDEFKDVPWYLKPNFIKAVMYSFAAGIVALVAAIGGIYALSDSEKAEAKPEEVLEVIDEIMHAEHPSHTDIMPASAE